MSLRILPIVYVILFGILMYGLAKLFPRFTYEWDYALVLSVAVFLLGLLIVSVGGFQFRRASTTVNPRTPDKTRHLVVNGLYSYSRNPMYVGFLLFVLAMGIFLSNLISILTVPFFVPLINFVQILPEERVLEKLFGDDFRAYRQSVRRWL